MNMAIRKDNDVGWGCRVRFTWFGKPWLLFSASACRTWSNDVCRRYQKHKVKTP